MVCIIYYLIVIFKNSEKYLNNFKLFILNNGMVSMLVINNEIN